MLQGLWIAIVVIIVALYGCAVPTTAEYSHQGGRGGEHAGAVSSGGAQHGRGATSGGMGHGSLGGHGASTGGLGRK